jgi:hypothetical protein
MYDEREQQALRKEFKFMKNNPHLFIVKVIDDFIDNDH